MSVQDLYPQRKKIRLDPANYRDPTTASFVTICTADRAPVFSNRALAAACVELLRSRVEAAGTPAYDYCFMPDHVHLLFSFSPCKSITEFVGEFKNLSMRLAW